jgi:Cytochrome P450
MFDSIAKYGPHSGPIVRINPYELHINDPEYYDEIYTGPTQKRDKWAWSAKMFSNSPSVLGTVSHDHHRRRRAVLNPYFSKRSVVKLEGMIQAQIDTLCARFRDFQKAREPIPLGLAFAAMTTDIITEYSFSKSYGFLLTPDFAAGWADVMRDASELSLLNKQFGWLLPLLKSMPVWVVKITNPQMTQLIYLQTVSF